jgi:hypothetical protein
MTAITAPDMPDRPLGLLQTGGQGAGGRLRSRRLSRGFALRPSLALATGGRCRKGRNGDQAG